MKAIERLFKRVYLAARILLHYGTLNPEKVRLVRSDHSIHVDPRDPRARKKLIADTMRGKFPRNQHFWRTANEIVQPDVVLDIGLNYGECLFALTYPTECRMFGFEANPRLADVTQRSLAAHPSRRQMELLFQLVTDGDQGVERFYIDKRASGGSTAAIPPHEFNPATHDCIEVAKASID